jgi:hypothetical protein
MDPRMVGELARIQGGTAAQYEYRSRCADAGHNALDSHPKVGADPVKAHALALRVVRHQRPDFTHELLR